VCGNTFRMLAASRFAPHFQFVGDDSRHFGPFPGCGGGLPFRGDGPGGDGATSGACSSDATASKQPLGGTSAGGCC